MASIFKRGDTWWICYYVHGKQVRRSLKTSNKRLAEREQQAIEAKLLDPHFEAPRRRNQLIDEFWQEYLVWANDHKRSGSIERTTIFWNQLVEFSRAKRVGDLKPDDIEGFKRWRKELGNSEQTINNGLRELKSVFNRGKKLGIFTGKSPVDGVEPYPISQKQPDFHNKKELERLLQTATKQSRELKWTVLLGGWAGLRKAEIACCRWEWFDFNKKQPTIHVTGSHGFEIKDYDDRSIPMNRRIYDELFPFRQAEGYVFPEIRKGPHLRYRVDLSESLMVALKKAGLPTKKPYQRLRHSFGSILAQKGVSVFKISKWMGHSTVVVTEKHYAGLQSYDPEINAF